MNNDEERSSPAKSTVQVRQASFKKRLQGTISGHGRLSTAQFNFRIPANQGAADHVAEQHGQDSWRYSILRFVHSNQVQKILMVLLLLDVLILCGEMLLLSLYPHCSIIERDAISCCPARNITARFLADSGDICEEPFLYEYTKYPAGCDEHKWHTVHTIENAFFYTTVVILSLFFIELNLSMIALTPCIFFRQFFFLLDYVIIAISLALEITFHALHEYVYSTMAGLLVLVRVWRFVRIGHGIVELTAEAAHKEYEGLLTYTEELEDRLRANNIDLPDIDPDTMMIHREASAHDGSDNNILHEIEREERKEHRKQWGWRSRLMRSYNSESEEHGARQTLSTVHEEDHVVQTSHERE